MEKSRVLTEENRKCFRAGRRIDILLSKRAGQQEQGLRCKGLWILFLPVLIGLHAMSMSEGSDNLAENNIVYGFTPDRGRWSHYASDPADTIYLYDTKSVLKTNNKVRVWIKFGEPVNDNGNDRFYKEATALKEIECNTRLIRTVQWHYLSVKEMHYKSASPTKWENIEPESADDALLEEVCAQPPKVKRRASPGGFRRILFGGSPPEERSVIAA